MRIGVKLLQVVIAIGVLAAGCSQPPLAPTQASSAVASYSTASVSTPLTAQSQSQVQACVDLGYKADVCATCAVAGIGHNAQDYGACYCKFLPDLLAQFGNFGQCVNWVQENWRP
jgi:hypothetical protein